MNQTEETAASQYLTFRLEEEIFALDVAQVREVLDMSTITKVPGTPDFMRGVINVRGSVVPVMDLRVKFGMSRTENSVDTRIIVMEISLDGEMIVLGTLADSVNEVIDLEAGQIEPPPSIGMRWRTEFIRGIGKRNDKFIILLDIDRVFSSDELAVVEGSGNRTVPEPEENTENTGKNTDETGFSE
ncbi:MAG: chemotaxis protein CheW [Desulfococcaceae bacterium]